jgi:hypothetical protein
MFELVAGVIGGFMVKNWISILVFSIIVGAIQTAHLLVKVSLGRAQMKRAMGPAEFRSFQHEIGSIDGPRMAKDMIAMKPSMAIFVQQFMWSSVTAGVPCLIVGGIRLVFFV